MNRLSPASSDPTVPTMKLHWMMVATMAAATACSGKTPPPARPAPVDTRPPPPSGPTRTDFKTIAKKLMARCVAGGWIDTWRASAPDVDVAKPRIFVAEFEDKTDQDLDPSYLRTVLEKRMRLSGVYELVTESAERDFTGRGRLLRLAERVGGKRVSVYTATLDMLDPNSGAVAYSCEATVRGEL